MSKYIFILIIVFIAFFSSCKKQNEITAPLSEVVSGKFLVDSIGTIVSVKLDTVSGKQHTYINFALVYHFENFPANLDQVSISIKNSYGVIISIDYIGAGRDTVLYRFKDTYELRDSLSGKDSVMIIRGLSGEFFTKNSDNTFNYLNNFVWQDSVYVIVKR
jgi:hypothetical protein